MRSGSRDLALEVGQKGAAFFLFAAFPGFFFYHLLAAFGAIPLFLGGGATAISLMGSLVLVVPAIIIFKARTKDVSVYLFALFVAVVLGYSLFMYFFGVEHQRDRVVFTENLKLIVGLVFLFSVGYLIPTSDAMNRALVFVLAFIMIFVVLFADYSSNTFIPSMMRGAPEGISDYQGLATAVAVVAVLALTTATRPFAAAFVIGSGAVCLFLISARGEITAFALVVLGWCAFMIWTRRFRAAGLGLAVYLLANATMLAVPTVALFAEKSFNSQTSVTVTGSTGETAFSDETAFYANQRQLEFFTGESESAEIRLKTITTAFQRVSQSPLVGDYAGQVRDFGEFGYYAHNMVSAWQQFGLIGFSIYAALCVMPFAAGTWLVFFEGRGDRAALSLLLFGGFTFALVLGVKSVYWPLPALAWGLLAAHPVFLPTSENER